MTRRTIFSAFAAAILLAGTSAYGQRRDEIRDRQGRLIGTNVHRGDGEREARDRLGQWLTKGDSLSALLVSGEASVWARR